MIVTLSRQLGSQGDAIAASVAAALGLRLIDREHISSVAAAAGIPETVLHNLMYEDYRSLAAEILNSLRGPSGPSAAAPQPASPLAGVFAPMHRPAAVTPQDAVAAIGQLIKDIAQQSDVLILGQGGQVVLRDYSGVCHVQVVAPLPLRIERVAQREGLPAAAARRRVRANDLVRADYLARYYGIKWLDPLHYHVVVNTGLTPIDLAVSLVVEAAKSLAKS